MEHASGSSCQGAAAASEEPCSSHEHAAAGEPPADKCELLETKAKLAKVEASRDSIARDLGHQKGSIAKVRGVL